MQGFDLHSLADARMAEIREEQAAAARYRAVLAQQHPRRRLPLGERLRVAFTGWVDLPEMSREAAGTPRP